MHDKTAWEKKSGSSSLLQSVIWFTPRWSRFLVNELEVTSIFLYGQVSASCSWHKFIFSGHSTAYAVVKFLLQSFCIIIRSTFFPQKICVTVKVTLHKYFCVQYVTEHVISGLDNWLEILYSFFETKWDPNPVQNTMEFYLIILDHTSIWFLGACLLSVVLCQNKWIPWDLI